MIRKLKKNIILLILTVFVIGALIVQHKWGQPMEMFLPAYPTNEARTYTGIQAKDNFLDYPCLSGVPPSQGLRKHGKCVRTVSRLNFDKPAAIMEGCTYLKVERKYTPICTYDPLIDSISGKIHKEGIWERHQTFHMLRALMATPDMVLFDVGTNIGVYCIIAALHNRRAVCVDANPENLRKITRSLYLGRLTEKVDLIWNAVSNTHRDVQFHLAKGNYGMSRIADLDKWNTETEANITVNTITLNDLQDYHRFRNTPVYMKLDVEAHELHVLKAADEFFQKVDVKIVQVELGENDIILDIVDIFEKNGFLPFADPYGENIYYKKDAVAEPRVWAYDVYFIR